MRNKMSFIFCFSLFFVLSSCNLKMSTPLELAPQNNSFGTTLTPISLMPLNYQTLKSRILFPKCLKCHSSYGEESDLSFETYADLMVIDRHWKAPAANSKAIEEITNFEDGMPPPYSESGIKPLTDEEIDFVARWIDAGNPEN